MTARQIFLDTETTGLSPEKGHRLVEIAALAYENRQPIAPEQGGSFHFYLNPDREIDQEAQAIHGLSQSFLQTQPRFEEIVDKFIQFVRDSTLIIHNAEFDRSFIDSELSRLRYPPLENIIAKSGLVCSLRWSRRHNVHLNNHSLDALCDHFGVDRSRRTNHNAMLDTQLLAMVYFRMIRQQGEMDIPTTTPIFKFNGQAVRVIKATPQELQNHNRFIENMQVQTGLPPLFFNHQ